MGFYGFLRPFCGYFCPVNESVSAQIRWLAAPALIKNSREILRKIYKILGKEVSRRQISSRKKYTSRKLRKPSCGENKVISLVYSYAKTLKFS